MSENRSLERDGQDGRVTFLFTDIEGSTRLLERLGERYITLLDDHHRILREAIMAEGGREVDTQGDAFFVSFVRVKDALAAVIAAQRALGQHAWPDGAQVLVRMGLHTGEPWEVGSGYVGMDVHRAARIAHAGHGGQVLLSETTTELVLKQLPEDVQCRDLGLYQLKDMKFGEHIFQLIIPELPSRFPPLLAMRGAPNNLPSQLSSFIGRQREIGEVIALCANARLVTLTGVGGCGKTRLSIEVAKGLSGDYPHGIWYVELAPLSDPALVPYAVANTLGLREITGISIQEILLNYLRNKRAMLILDNCEHLIAACANLSETILHACPRLHILASSREAIGIGGEVIYQVPSLETADPAHMPDLVTLGNIDSVHLLVERAAGVKAGFAMSEDNAFAIAHICQRLDGIPLAIELAAARVKVLPVEQIMQRLDERFRLLTGGSRTALPRQQTLRATIDWSYNLLSDEERLLFRRLAVFVGGWDLEAAETVCAGDGLEVGDILDLLSQLVDKSLVTTKEELGGIRFRRLETVRQYARERLMETEEGNRVRQRHLACFLSFAEDYAVKIHGPGATKWLQRMDIEHDNLRAAFAYASGDEFDGEASLRLTYALHWYWDMRNLQGEAFSWEERALQQSQALAGTAARARVEGQHAILTAIYASQYTEAQRLWRESLMTLRALGDAYRRDCAYILIWMGLMCQEKDTRDDYFLEAIAIYREEGDKRGLCWALNFSSMWKHVERDLDAACNMAAEGVRLSREIHDRYTLAVLLGALGEYQASAGLYLEARRNLTEALQIFDEFENLGFGCQVRLTRGDVARGLQEHADAERYYRQGLAEIDDFGHHGFFTRLYAWMLAATGYCLLRQEQVVEAIAMFKKTLRYLDEREFGPQSHGERTVYAVEGLAAVVAVQGDYELAARLWGACAAQIRSFQEMGYFAQSLMEPVHALELEHYQPACRAALGAGGFEAMWAAGQDMTLEEAKQVALEVVA